MNIVNKFHPREIENIYDKDEGILIRIEDYKSLLSALKLRDDDAKDYAKEITRLQKKVKKLEGK